VPGAIAGAWNPEGDNDLAEHLAAFQPCQAALEFGKRKRSLVMRKYGIKLGQMRNPARNFLTANGGAATAIVPDARAPSLRSRS
jgi:hypothetical protein